MTERKILRLIGDLQEVERNNVATADNLDGMACQAESLGQMDYGAALRILADAWRAVDREHTKLTIKAIRAAQESYGL